MLKNARFTFEKYSGPDWPCENGRARAYTFVPDEIFEPVLTTLRLHAHDILKHSDILMIESLKAGRGRVWSWQETMTAVQSMWQELDKGYGQFMTDIIDNAAFRHKDAPTGRGDGRCFSDYVEIERDGSVNDPVCAMHESGHLAAFLKAPDQDNNEPAPNIKEIQAMFAQEQAYEWLTTHAFNAEEARSVRRHRLNYYTGLLSNIPLYLFKMERPATCQIGLADTFARWSVDIRMLPYLMRDQEFNNKGPQNLHLHPFAAMLASALFERFQGKEAEDRKRILSVLYEGGPETTLMDVLSAFDIETPEDVRVAAEQTCYNFKDELACNIQASPATFAL